MTTTATSRNTPPSAANPHSGERRSATYPVGSSPTAMTPVERLFSSAIWMKERSRNNRNRVNTGQKSPNVRVAW
ncbi:MAG: hypothetical protein J07HB67_00254 [halophilic archaeon J07HB67]|nr:MAG: hypothetical protein J07HB67_00254 [halophilic archaeon J07HB67]